MDAHYSLEEAREEVGKSKSLNLAKKVSIKKWQERQKYGEDAHYDIEEMCGFCLVISNIDNWSLFCGKLCPANKICCQVTAGKSTRPETIIKRIRALKLREAKW